MIHLVTIYKPEGVSNNRVLWYIERKEKWVDPSLQSQVIGPGRAGI